MVVVVHGPRGVEHPCAVGEVNSGPGPVWQIRASDVERPAQSKKEPRKPQTLSQWPCEGPRVPPQAALHLVVGSRAHSPVGLWLPERERESCVRSPTLQLGKLRLRQGKQLLVMVTARLVSSSAGRVLERGLLHSGDTVISGFSSEPPTA